MRRAGSIDDTGEIERTILVLRAAGLSPRRFGRQDLVAALLRRRRRDGSWGGNVSISAWGLIALRATRAGIRSRPVRRARSWLEGTQNRDGGFGLLPRAAGEVDITGAAVQALAAAGRRGTRPTRQAVAYLRRCQNHDGGFGMRKGRPSNAPSTAWATQGLAAGRTGSQASIRRAVGYLKRLQRRDGRIAYSRSSTQTPVWVTAQALPALLRKPFPISSVPRR